MPVHKNPGVVKLLHQLFGARRIESFAAQCLDELTVSNFLTRHPIDYGCHRPVNFKDRARGYEIEKTPAATIEGMKFAQTIVMRLRGRHCETFITESPLADPNSCIAAP